MNARSAVGGEAARTQSRGQEVVALYRELLSTYTRLYALARGQEYDQVNREADRTQALVDRLRRITAEGETEIDLSGASEQPQLLNNLWAETARALTEIVEMRALVLRSLDRAVDETRDALVVLGRNRTALGAYRRPQDNLPRLQSCRL